MIWLQYNLKSEQNLKTIFLKLKELVMFLAHKVYTLCIQIWRENDFLFKKKKNCWTNQICVQSVYFVCKKYYSN
jgi:hypothetical protein